MRLRDDVHVVAHLARRDVVSLDLDVAQQPRRGAVAHVEEQRVHRQQRRVAAVAVAAADRLVVDVVVGCVEGVAEDQQPVAVEPLP